MKQHVYTTLAIFLLSIPCVRAQHAAPRQSSIPARVDSLLRLMTLDEKIGQLNQYTNDLAATGPVTNSKNKLEEIRQGRVGSMLNVKGAANTRVLQEVAMQSRLKIPL